MLRSTLSLDAALALLDGYEDDNDANALVLASEPLSLLRASPSSCSSSPDSEQSLVKVSGKNSTDRFKRARERKKRELSQLRLQARGLEETLRRLKQQRLHDNSSEELVWRQAANRQLQERQEAEQLNLQLRKMVDATLRQSRRLRSMLAYPEGFVPLMYHKRLHPHPEMINIASLVELHGLLISVDMLEMQMDETLAPFQGGAETQLQCLGRRGGSGCHLLVEAFNESVVPCDLLAASEGVWQKLAFDNASLEDRAAHNGTTISRVFKMEVAKNDLRLSYTGSAIYRKRVLSDGRVVVVWSSEWEPVGLHDWNDISHESFRRQGMVCLSPAAVDPTRFTQVQMFYRIERDACGDLSCERGATGDKTVLEAEKAVCECVVSEMKRTIQGMENDLIVPRVSEAPCSITAMDHGVLDELTV